MSSRSFEEHEPHCRSQNHQAPIDLLRKRNVLELQTYPGDPNIKAAEIPESR
jgi:hypothetical protein